MSGRPFLPSTGTQVDTAVIQAGIANRVAYEQASKGVDPSVAAVHAGNVAGVTLAWCLFVLLPTVFACVAAPLMHSPIAFFWALGAAVGAWVLRECLGNWRRRPVGVRSTWRVSGGLLVAIWVTWYVSIVPVAILVAVTK